MTAAGGSLGHVLILPVRNEGPDVLEWVALRRAIGFELIRIASDDCTDRTDLVLKNACHSAAYVDNLARAVDVFWYPL